MSAHSKELGKVLGDNYESLIRACTWGKIEKDKACREEIGNAYRVIEKYRNKM